MKKCMFCEDSFSKKDIEELTEMGEKFWLTKDGFVCPDCYDDLRRLPLESQLEALLKKGDYVWAERA